ncbi:prepilin-type N-terminal cleavage/methylation domain-containing protein [Natronospirillum operosum]|uniref:Type II secretion system protein H n=2 Tax=Natronospirillum operosum TaxID=2759953 RepID=A0A4Z0WA21_9GAMM|nr:prepilin-type N-terminal cleavage/methylation domain-containing protein [Natronospirillum operosum]
MQGRRQLRSMQAARQQGLSILELMMVVILVGILALLAVPNMNLVVENSRVRSATNDLVTALSLARSEAVRNSTDIQVLARNNSDNTPDFAAGWCVVAVDDNCSNPTRLYDAPGNAQVTLNGDTSIRFNRTGERLNDNNISITFAPPNCQAGQPRARQIQVRPSGRAAVSEEDC